LLEDKDTSLSTSRSTRSPWSGKASGAGTLTHAYKRNNISLSCCCNVNAMHSEVKLDLISFHAGTLPGSHSIAKYYDNEIVQKKPKVAQLGLQFPFGAHHTTKKVKTARPSSAQASSRRRGSVSSSRPSTAVGSRSGGSSYRSSSSKANQLWKSLTTHNHQNLGPLGGRGSPFFDKIV